MAHYYYRPGSHYLVEIKGELFACELKDFSECKTGDNQEICRGCPGKLYFECEGQTIIKCGWVYNKYSKDYESKYQKVHVNGVKK